MTYEEAINLVKQGNEYGFQYLYDTTYRTCLYAIGEIVKDSMEAEDILQDAYMNAIKKIDSLKDPEKFPSWFRTMASRLAINRVNKNKKTQTVNPGEDETPESVMDRMVNEKLGSGQITPEEAYETKEISGLLHEIIDELPEKQRQCILLFYMEEYSIKDIAEACKCNENTVKSRLNYGKQKLEEKTLELQQKGYVLWGVSPVYLITWLLRSDMANKLKFVYSNTQTLEYMNSIFYSLVNAGIIESTAGMSTITGGVSDGVSSGMVNGGVSNSAVTGSVSNGAVTGGVSNVVKGGVTKGSAAAIKGGIHTVAGKIVAGAVAAAITGGLITTGVIINNNNKNDNEIVAEVTEAASEEASTTEVITTEEVTEAATTEVASEEDLISDTIISGDINELNIFEKFPSKFIFASGVGGWATELYIESDGSFTGHYYDYNLGDLEAYMCDFYGKFTTPKKINDYTYSMHLESLNYSEEEGTVYYEDDIKCTYVEDACGLDYADEIYIYLPGAPVSELPEEFLSWVGITADTYDTLPANYYGLYNITGKMGFSGSSDN